MKNVFDSLTTLYARLLHLYPRRFQAEFAEEMEVVFRDSLNEAFEKGVLPFIIVCIKELGGLPLNILREFWHEFGRKETVMVTNERMELTSTRSNKASHWEAFLSALPFAIFGVVCMIGKIRVPWVGIYVSLTFYFFVLLGLLIGLVKAFRSPKPMQICTWQIAVWFLLRRALWRRAPSYMLSAGVTSRRAYGSFL
jgi:hypothetical protein